MCGITGYINLKSEIARSTAPIISMLNTQKHRGPDDSGVRAFSLARGTSLELDTETPQDINGNFEGIIGFNRLSILDLSMNGHQPMISPDGQVILTLNGEIYNAFDFKPELAREGFIFKSTSDTEIVLSLYLKYGFEKMIMLLNGMFAIVLIDLSKKIVYIARDRFGIKPMYYINNNEYLAFSSETKSFRHLKNFKPELNVDNLDEFMLFRSNIDGSLLKGVYTVLPGSFLTYSHDKGLCQHVYYNVDRLHRKDTDESTFEESLSLLNSSLSKSVKSQLISDVKLGCQLSGGIDSSLVTWYANNTVEQGNFEAVSIVFDNKSYSEEKYVDKVASQLGIVAHKFLLSPDYYFEHIEKATWHFEAPLNHPNTVGIYLLSQRAKEFVTVLLSGEGADEVFGGYRRFHDIRFPFVNTLFAEKLRTGIKEQSSFIDYFDPALRSVMASSFISPSLARQLYPDFKKSKAIDNRTQIFKALSGSVFSRQVKYEIKTYLPDLLIRQDKMSMAHSIENRVPFLDNNVVIDSFRIPEKHLIKRYSPEGLNSEKYLLKKSAEKIYGKEFSFRKKMGFGIPLRQFYSNHRFLEYINDKIIPGTRFRGIINPEPIEAWLKARQHISFHENEALWIAIAFEVWASTCLDN